MADNDDVRLPFDPVIDEAQTGTNFNRDGTQELFRKIAENEIDFLLVENFNRIGRSAAETLYFLYLLQSKCGVKLLTPSGEHDVETEEGLFHTTLMALMAEVQNEIRTSKAKRERIRGFLQKKNWRYTSAKIPLGYQERDDGWLEVNEGNKSIVRAPFRKFVECEKYANTADYINDRYGKHILDGHCVKTILQNSVYIGKPTVPEQWLVDTTYENNLENSSLHLLKHEPNEDVKVSEAHFHRAQDIIKRKDQKRSTDDETMDLMDFIEELSLFAVVERSDPAKLVYGCGEPLARTVKSPSRVG